MWFDIADVECVVWGYWDVNIELLIGNIYQWEFGGYNKIWQMCCVWSGDTEKLM